MLLAMVMLLALPVEAGAAARVTASVSAANQAGIRSIKRGKTTVTVLGGGRQKLNSGYVKFTAPASRTYKITLSNLHKYRRSSSKDILVGGAMFLKEGRDKRVSFVKFKQNGKRNETMLMQGSARAAKVYDGKKATTETPLRTRTVSIRLRKGEKLYFVLANLEGTPRKTCKLCYDVTIR